MMCHRVFWIVTVVSTLLVARAEIVPVLDAIPVISQIKSLVQMVAGDKDGATETASHFANGGFGPAQFRSAYHLITGNGEKAWEIQKDFGKSFEVVLDSTPLLGHAKGAIHLLVGDTEHGLEAIKSATSNTGVLAGAVLGGPLGAVAGHALTDLTISGLDSVVNGNSSRPHGIVDYALNFKDRKPGEHFDMVTGLVMDVVGGTTSAKVRKSGNKNAARNKSPNGVVETKIPKVETSKVRPPEREISERKTPVGGNSERGTPDGQISEVRPPEREISERGTPDGQISERGTPDGQISEVRPPEREISERGTPDGQISEVRLPKREISEEETAVSGNSKTSEVGPPERIISENENPVRKISEKETPDKKATFETYPRVGISSYVASLRKQFNIRQMFEVQFSFLDAVERINTNMFYNFVSFIRNDFTYRELFDCEYSSVASSTFSDMESLRFSTRLWRLDVEWLKNILTYLTESQKSLITHNEFRTVNTIAETNNCFGCAVAGAIGMDLTTLQGTILRVPTEAYSAFVGSNPIRYIQECKRARLLDYTVSERIYGISNLMNYLRTNIRRLEDKFLVMTEYSDLFGHAVVLKLKVENYVSDPTLLVIDYQQPAFLSPGLPNPLRFTPYIDTVNYESFMIFALYFL